MLGVTVELLPFENLSGEPDQEIFARGFGLDLATELARFRTLEVVHARPKDASVDAAPATIGSAPTFALQGGIRRVGDRVRISVQLIERASSRQIWADRFEPCAAELLSVQDEIASRVVAALSVRADEAALADARRKPLVSLEVYECWLRGRECLLRGSVESDDEARVFFRRALDIDPLYARAHAGLSLSHFNEWSCQAWVHWDETERLAFEHARRAAELDNSDAVVEIVLARVKLYRRLFDEADHHVQRALALNPHDADVLGHAAMCRAYLGDPAVALTLAETAIQLNPRPPDWYYVVEAMALFLLGRYRESIPVAARVPTATLDSPVIAAAASALTGDLDRARAFLRLFLEQFETKVTFSRAPERGEPLRWLLHVNPFRSDTAVEPMTRGLALAGLEPDPDAIRRAVPARKAAQALFRREGEFWRFVFDGLSAQLSDAKGFHDLAALLTRPGEEQHCLELAGRPAEPGGADAVLDDRARREYRSRIRELQREIDRATESHDLASGQRAREELDVLVETLSDAVGLAGRSRALGSVSERARSAVTWRIRSAIKKIAASHPRLGRHLENSIRTGTYCVYSPEQQIAWQT